MASLAMLAFLAFVHVIVFVAGEAGGTIFFFLGVAAVAVLASDVFVCALERKFGIFVV